MCAICSILCIQLAFARTGLCVLAMFQWLTLWQLACLWGRCKLISFFFHVYVWYTLCLVCICSASDFRSECTVGVHNAGVIFLEQHCWDEFSVANTHTHSHTHTHVVLSSNCMWVGWAYMYMCCLLVCYLVGCLLAWLLGCLIAWVVWWMACGRLLACLLGWLVG